MSGETMGSTTRRPKARGKTFTGCWTCRERKVKCDEARPECSNCMLRGRLCKGYGRKLLWTSVQDSHRAPQSQRNLSYSADDLYKPGSRRFVGGPNRDLPGLTSRALQRAIASADTACKPLSSLFGVFNCRPILSGTESILDSSEADSKILCASEEKLPDGQRTTPGMDNSDLSISLDCPSRFDFEWTFDSAISPRGFDDDFDDPPFACDTTHPSDLLGVHREETSLPSVESNGSEATSSSDPARARRYIFENHSDSDERLALSPVLRGSSPRWQRLYNEAIHHYATRLAYYMMPVEVPQEQNPWLHTFLARAVSTNEFSKSGNALFHALLSAACFHRAQLDGSGKHEQEGGFHQQKALGDLRMGLKALQTEGPSMEDVINLLACVLTMTTIEAMRGTSGGWTMHLEGAFQLLKTIEGRSDSYAQNQTVRLLCQIHDCLHTLMCTMSPQLTMEYDGRIAENQAASKTVPDSISEISAAWFAEGQYYLDVTYGVSIDTFMCLKRINALAARLHCPDSSADVIETHRELNSVSEALFSVVPTTNHSPASHFHRTASKVLKMRNVASPLAQEVMENHCWAFHFAVILYFNRVSFVLRQTSLGEQQWLVGQALNHLETIESIGGQDARPVTLWPLLVSSCEASEPPLRRRVLLLFASMQRFGIGNVKVAKQVALEVWRRMDRQKGLGRSWQSDHMYHMNSVPLPALSNTMWDSQHSSEPMSGVDWRKVMKELATDIVLA